MPTNTDTYSVVHTLLSLWSCMRLFRERRLAAVFFNFIHILIIFFRLIDCCLFRSALAANEFYIFSFFTYFGLPLWITVNCLLFFLFWWFFYVQISYKNNRIEKKTLGAGALLSTRVLLLFAQKMRFFFLFRFDSFIWTYAGILIFFLNLFSN